jgi:hypothetical protein
MVLLVACMGLCVQAMAQQGQRAEQMPAVTVTAKANPNPAEKSYRKMGDSGYRQVLCLCQ